ncbi:MAG: GNAT family N-acetyltransferase [Lachnospiraceae bacterium]|nr:GNAT family N-acetyltransferase [Lachnospiraceae bacterium]
MNIQGVVVREGTRDDWMSAKQLAWTCFNEFDAQDYTKDGAEHFLNFLKDEKLTQMFYIGSYRLFVASLYGRIVGMLTLRERAHISLLFVDGNCQRNGIGSALVRLAAQMIADEARGDTMSVHASPYAVPFYEKLGFTATEREKEQDGIRFTPMLLELK